MSEAAQGEAAVAGVERSGGRGSTMLAPSTSGGLRESKRVRGAGHLHRDLGDRVAQREEHGAEARAPGELGDLALDPDRAELADPLRQRVGHRPHRGRGLGGGVAQGGHGGEPRCPAADRPPTMLICRPSVDSRP